jgi:hypothetical protein
VRFLREVNLDTKAKNKLKNLLILACRLLTFTFLILAFAQPYIPQANATVKTGDKAVSIFIDNSFSMDALGKNGTLLDEAKKDAKDIAAAYKPTDRFQLLTNDFEGRHQRLVNREEFLELVDEVKSSPAVRTVSEIASRQHDALVTADGIQPGNYQAFVVSDFQKTITDLDAVKIDTLVDYRFVPVVAENRNNVYVDSVWFTSPVRKLNSPEELHVRLKSHSETDLENVPMRLYVNGQARTPASFSISANGTTDTSIFFSVREPGLQQGLIEINDYPVTFDDRFYFSFNVLRNIPVLIIEPEAKFTGPSTGNQNALSSFSTGNYDYIDSAFATDSIFAVTEMDESKLDYSSFRNFHYIVLNSLDEVSSGLGNELHDFVNNGGSVFVFPGTKADLTSYSDFLSPLNISSFTKDDTVNTVVDKLYYDHPLFKGVFEKQSGNIDLPSVSEHYKIPLATQSTGDVMMRMRNGDIFTISYKTGKGNVYLCAVPVNDSWSNLPQHALIVPSLLQPAFFSQPQRNLFYTIGSDETVEIGDPGVVGENVFHLSDSAQNFDIIPAHTVVNGNTLIDVHKQVTKPGNYLITLGKEQLAGVAFNFNRKESDLSTFTSEELTAAITTAGLKKFYVVNPDSKGLTAALTEIDNGIRYWKLCIWLALIFLLCEVLVIRFWKNQIVNITPVSN